MLRASAVLLAVLLLCPTPARADPFDTTRVGDGMFDLSLSRDARILAFRSNSDLDPGHPGFAGARAYVRHLRTGTTERLVRSVRSADGSPMPTFARPPFPPRPELSANGRFACIGLYEERDTSEQAPPADWSEGRLAVVTVSTGQAAVVPGSVLLSTDESADRDPGYCSVSDDGMSVAYSTRERHSAADANDGYDVYAYSLARASWTLVSRGDGSEAPAGAPNLRPHPSTSDELAWRGGGSQGPHMTPDGRYIAFWSRSSDLSAEDDDDAWDIFVRDLWSGRTEWISRADGPDGGPGAGSPQHDPRYDDGGSYVPVISDDGRYVAFDSNRTGLDPIDRREPSDPDSAFQVYRRDRATGSTELVSRGTEPRKGALVLAARTGGRASISKDGRYVAYAAVAVVAEPRHDPVSRVILVRDTVADTTSVVSRKSGAAGALLEGAADAHISGDGRHVLFSTTPTLFHNYDAYTWPGPEAFIREPLSASGELPADLVGPPNLYDLDLNSLPTASQAFAARNLRPRLRFRLSEVAAVTVRLRRAGSGKVRVVKIDGRRGRNEARLPRRLRAGRYVAVVRARDLAGLTSKRRRVTFRVPAR
jgi:hypothetical protein